MDDFLTPLTSASLFASSTEQIEDIRIAAGFPKAQFDAVFLPLLHAYALNVQRLPLSPTSYHKPGGAWQFGLFLSILTLRVSASRMFYPTLDSKQRRTLEQQCRFAAFAAGLASGVAILTQNVRLTDAKGGEFYPLNAPDTLATWLEKAEQPLFNWRTQDDPLTSQECAAIAARFLPARIMQPFDSRIVRMVYGAVYPQSAPNALETTLARVVRESINATDKYYVDKFNQSYDLDTKAAPVFTRKDASNLATEIADDGVIRDIENPLAIPADAPAPADPSSAEGEVDDSTDENAGSPASQSPHAPAASPVATPRLSVVAPAPAPATVPVSTSRPASSPPPASASASPAFMARHGLVHKPLGVVEPEEEPPVTHLTLLAAASPELKDWFKALRSHDAYDRLKEKLKVTEDGIEVPSSLIGHLGLNLRTVLKFMDEAGMIKKRSKDQMTVFLHEALTPLFFESE